MAGIHPQLEQYRKDGKNEENFRDQFLMPLVQRMGFSLVDNVHGVNEKGQDITFSEIDTFGQYQYDTIQAKFEDKINRGKVMDDLIRQCKRATGAIHKRKSDNSEYSIRSFIIANAGTITEDGIEYFFDEMPNSYRGRVFFLEGKDLVKLDQIASVRRREVVEPLIVGLKNEFAFNIAMTGIIEFALKQWSPENRVLPVEKFRTQALKTYLSRPIAIPGIAPVELSQICEALDKYEGTMTVTWTVDLDKKQDHISTLLSFLPNFVNHFGLMVARLMIAQEKLGPLVESHEHVSITSPPMNTNE